MLSPTAASATTVRLGPDVPTSLDPVARHDCMGPCEGGATYAQVVSPDALQEAPASGTITAWRVFGLGSLKLRVLRPAGEEESDLVGEGTSALATNHEGGANATSLPIRAGDEIGVDVPNGAGGGVAYKKVMTESAVSLFWSPALAEQGPFETPKSEEREIEFYLNADIVLAPVVSSLAPASGAPTGGNAVKITGRDFDGATGVTFGSTQASSFSVDSTGQITAIAPASAPATVDLRVTGPGGASETGPADRYTFLSPPGSTTTTTTAGAGLAKLAVSGFGESASKWRRGRALPHIAGVAVGTTFRFVLNEAATATFTFSRSVAGRRVHGRCVAATAGNSRKPRCRRTVGAGSFSVAGHAGLDKVPFQGRLSSTRTLNPGTYTVTLNVRDAHGLRAASQPLTFTITR